jgi:UDP-N-acetylglucosamine 2-epimerase (non-hydrolysing)
MTPGQDLFDVTARVLGGLKRVLRQERPALVVVQGDTTTSFAGALAAYYEKIPVAHVEAGLRTGDRYAPFPEEVNRRLTGVLADFHFAPTAWARDNLLAEGAPPERIWVTGNTVIDALHLVAGQVRQEEAHWRRRLAETHGLDLDGRRLVLVTGHRRENFGEGFAQICLALKDLVESRPDLHLVYPVHLNPNVQGPVFELFGPDAGRTGAAAGTRHLEALGGSRLSLLPPLDYEPFVYLLQQSHLVLTDSGGIQEEAPALGKPVLVMREVTERPEGVWAGTVKLVGADRQRIVAGVVELLNHPGLYDAMARAHNPYGDGRAAARIAEIVQGLMK